MDEQWYQAWNWLVRQRKHYPANADIWDLRWRVLIHSNERARLYELVQQQDYRLEPMQAIRRRDGQTVMVWRSADALVLKWVALHLQSRLPLHPCCAHIRGHGGCHGARTAVLDAVHKQSDPESKYRFLYRTDIRGYYSSINKNQVLGHVQRYVDSPVLLTLVKQYLSAIIDDGGDYFSPKGITRGCALSPLIGATLLYEMDVSMAALMPEKIFYIRYMDDVIILAKKRWDLRRARSVLLRHMDSGGFTVHPDKTQVGKIPGVIFTWLGKRINTATSGVTNI